MRLGSCWMALVLFCGSCLFERNPEFSQADQLSTSADPSGEAGMTSNDGGAVSTTGSVESGADGSSSVTTGPQDTGAEATASNQTDGSTAGEGDCRATRFVEEFEDPRSRPWTLWQDEGVSLTVADSRLTWMLPAIQQRWGNLSFGLPVDVSAGWLSLELSEPPLTPGTTLKVVLSAATTFFSVDLRPHEVRVDARLDGDQYLDAVLGGDVAGDTVEGLRIERSGSTFEVTVRTSSGTTWSEVFENVMLPASTDLAFWAGVESTDGALPEPVSLESFDVCFALG